MEIPPGKFHIVGVKPQRGEKTYYYARKTARVNGSPKVVWSMPLGTAEDIVKHYTERVLDYIQFQTFSFGIPAAFLTIAKMTDFFNIVDTIAPKKMIKGALTTAQYLLAMMIGRTMGPLSKAETGRRFSDTFLNLIWTPVHHINTQNLVNHMDKLSVETVDKITEEFGAKLVSLGVKPSIILWDTSNYSTNIENWGEKKLPNPGNAKDKRFDKNLIGTGIVLSKDEIPLYHSVYPGNENDVHLFKRSINEIVSKIQKLCHGSNNITIVFDKGNNSEDNIQTVLENCHVVGSISFEEVPDLLEIPLEDFKFTYRTKKGTALMAYRVSRKLWNLGEFAVIVTYNPETKKRQIRTWERRKDKINQKLTELKERFERAKGKGRRMTVKGLTTNITKEIPKQYMALYWWNIDGKNRKFEWKLLEEKEEKMIKKFGKNVIFSDIKKLDTRRIVKLYHSKYKVEKTFRWFHDKLLIPIPPVYHNKDDRIRVHIFMCVMALSFLRLIKKQLKGVSVSDERLLEELRGLEVALVKDVRTDDVMLKVKEMSPIQAAIFSQLRLDKYIKVI